MMALSEGGLALGMLDIEMPYTIDLTTIAPGDRLLLYSDGVPEATNARQELFEGTVPLESYALGHRPDSAAEFISGLIGKIRAFTGDAPQSDDITALYLLRQ
jgi:sigma-B regulation protein RsbU (phosphoserine phosphatase)